MSYAQKYPHLFTSLDCPDEQFEAIASVIEKHVGDLFRLDLLEHEAKAPRLDGSYMSLFIQCVSILKIKNAFSPKQVLDGFREALADPGIQAYIQKTCIFSPSIDDDGRGPHLGYIEKLRHGSLSTAEPLTYVDMVRMIGMFDTRTWHEIKYETKPRDHIIGISHIKRLKQSDAGANHLMFVDFNEHFEGPAQWGVVVFKEGKPDRIYSESPLDDSEKRALDQVFGERLNDALYETDGSALSPSSGYAALSWVNDEITKLPSIHMTSTAGFYVQVGVLIRLMGDTRSISTRPDERRYESETYRFFDALRGYLPLSDLAEMSMLGMFLGVRLKENDLCTAMEILKEKTPHPTRSTVSAGSDRCAAEYRRSFVPRLCEAMVRMEILSEVDNKVRLVIPETLDVARLITEYYASGGFIELPSFVGIIASPLSKDKDEAIVQATALFTGKNMERLISAQVLSTFSGHAKTSELSIHMPASFNLSITDHNLIVQQTEANAHLTRIENTAGNDSIKWLIKRLLSTTARNRWLSANRYRPPMMDDFWRQAAKYWLIELHKNPDVLLPKEENHFFRQCVDEMGLKGLQGLLAFLGEKSERTLIDRILGDKKPPFYIGPQLEEVPSCAILSKEGTYDFPAIENLDRLMLTAECQTAYIQWREKLTSSEESSRIFYVDIRTRTCEELRLTSIALSNVNSIIRSKLIGYRREAVLTPADLYAISLVTGHTRSNIEALILHLQAGRYFPFSEIGIAYQPAFTEAFLGLLQELGTHKGFEKITITDAMQDPAGCRDFLNTLIDHVSTHAEWTGFIVMPELESDDYREDWRALRTLYAALNNTILQRRHVNMAETTISVIKEATSIDPIDEAAVSSRTSVEIPALNMDKLDQLDASLSWSLQAGASPQLQVQQQMEVQQQRHVQQEKELSPPTSVDEALVDLVFHDNIEKKLSSDLEKYPVLHIKSASLKTDEESPLQGFFHTWVSANPTTPAKEVIQAMTPTAARELLQKYRFLTSGLNPANLPKGFYTQRSRDGLLVLCYNAELGQVKPSTPLTLSLDVAVPTATPWKGDFRQFLREAGSTLAWPEISLFAALQPKQMEVERSYQAFIDTNPGLKAKMEGTLAHSKIAKHWSIFLQAWQFAGESGVDAFLEEPESTFEQSLDDNVRALFQGLGEKTNWVIGFLNHDPDHLRAMGQLYYSCGRAGLVLFIEKLQQVEMRLGSDFFVDFKAHVLTTTDNWAVFMSEGFFKALDGMMDSNNSLQVLAWRKILENHANAVGYDDIPKLWQGFRYFCTEISELSLQLDGHEFDGLLHTENMFVCMDRLLGCLQCLPTLEQRQAFLKQFKNLDTTHGGVYYALQHEGFKHVAPELRLHAFEEGSPTYAPDLDRLMEWTDDAALKLKRTLALETRFLKADEVHLSANIDSDPILFKSQLMWLLHTHYTSTSVDEVLGRLPSSDFLKTIAVYLHRAVYLHGQKHLNVYLEAMKALETLMDASIKAVLHNDNHAIFLEAVSLRWQLQEGVLTSDTIHALTDLFNGRTRKAHAYPESLYRDAFKLAALFGVDSSALNAFYRETTALPESVQLALQLLVTQLLSMNLEQTDHRLLRSADHWSALMGCITTMKAPEQLGYSARHRVDLMDAFIQQGFKFNYSKTGAIRKVSEDEATSPSLGLRDFKDHLTRLPRFMVGHLVIPSDMDASQALAPFMSFLKTLQSNHTYLNEVEPLLATLEKTKVGHYWSANYLTGLLHALQPEDDTASYPFDLLKILLSEARVAAQDIDGVEETFPIELTALLKRILKNTVFQPAEQTMLAQLALRELAWQNHLNVFDSLMDTLMRPEYVKTRHYVLQLCLTCDDHEALEATFNRCRLLLEHNSEFDVVREHWLDTSALWLKAMGAKASEQALFTEIQGISEGNTEKEALMLHIIAFSSLRPGLKDKDSQEYELNKKAPKLVKQLGRMSIDELRRLASVYPEEPSPGADDLLRLMKASKTDGLSWEQRLDAFMRHPYQTPRMDYGFVPKTRMLDLQRMIANTRVNRGSGPEALNLQEATRLGLLFSRVKALEAGTVFIGDTTQKVADLSKEELRAEFIRLSATLRDTPTNDLARAELWAVLFEVLGRTTRKYPHMAQQFALIANDCCMDTSSRVLKLATGEGKSHFVALRAAKHAGQGKKVDICTAKRTLAERDRDDYQWVFHYLGLKTAYLHAKSPREVYTDNDIRYSTLGDLSLFLDEQSHAGHPIALNPDAQVALFDEFDFIYFEEGQKTQYNYALPTDKTPKQMNWFYQAVNEFYRTAKNSGLLDMSQPKPITPAVLRQFALHLINEAGDDDEKRRFLAPLLDEPLQLVQWLRSAHTAHRLERGTHFILSDEIISINGVSLPMRKIVPLSGDMQRLPDSSFSAGVQQLLAVRLNTESRDSNEAEDVFIPMESNIVSSQVASHLVEMCWNTWEAFTGTVSAAQAALLHAKGGTNVLHIPTNRRERREWEKPVFCNTAEERFDEIARQTSLCLAGQQSILFSCKDDQQVKALKTALKRRLTAAEYKSLIFYKNEDKHKRSASTVLQEKHTQEAWKGGKKTYGRGLAAAGFGRGDNVEVEAVFLFDATDTNDWRQRGGRTARNGEEGHVFQFYLRSELNKAESDLRDSLSPEVRSEIELTLAQVVGHKNRDDEDEKCFERVKLLREYVANVASQPTQGYRRGIAQLSSWGLRQLSEIRTQQGEAVHNESVIRFYDQLKQLDKMWLELSNRADLSTRDRVRAIENTIQKVADDFARRATDILSKTISTLILRRYDFPTVQLVIEEDLVVSQKERQIASIAGVLASLPDAHFVPDLPQQLNRLNDVELATLAKHIDECVSVHQVMALLKTPVVVSRAEQDPLQGLAMAARVDLALLRETVEPSLQTRVNVLTRWETWAASAKLSEADKSAFLTHFCQVMQGFEEGRDWDQFMRFVKKTEHWWSLGNGRYQSDLLKFWAGLAANRGVLKTLHQAFDFDALPGKSWFLLPSALMQHEATAWMPYQDKVHAFWANVSAREGGKTRALDLFTTSMEGVGRFHQGFPAKMEALFGLPQASFEQLTHWFHENHALFYRYPELTDIVMDELWSSRDNAVFLYKLCTITPVMVQLLLQQHQRLFHLRETYAQALNDLIKTHGDSFAQYQLVFDLLLTHMESGNSVGSCHALVPLLLNAVRLPGLGEDPLRRFCGLFNGVEAQVGAPRFALIIQLLEEPLAVFVKNIQLTEYLLAIAKDGGRSKAFLDLIKNLLLAGVELPTDGLFGLVQRLGDSLNETQLALMQDFFKAHVQTLIACPALVNTLVCYLRFTSASIDGLKALSDMIRVVNASNLPTFMQALEAREGILHMPLQGFKSVMSLLAEKHRLFIEKPAVYALILDQWQSGCSIDEAHLVCSWCERGNDAFIDLLLRLKDKVFGALQLSLFKTLMDTHFDSLMSNPWLCSCLIGHMHDELSRHQYMALCERLIAASFVPGGQMEMFNEKLSGLKGRVDETRYLFIMGQLSESELLEACLKNKEIVAAFLDYACKETHSEGTIAVMKSILLQNTDPRLLRWHRNIDDLDERALTLIKPFFQENGVLLDTPSVFEFVRVYVQSAQSTAAGVSALQVALNALGAQLELGIKLIEKAKIIHFEESLFIKATHFAKELVSFMPEHEITCCWILSHIVKDRSERRLPTLISMMNAYPSLISLIPKASAHWFSLSDSQFDRLTGLISSAAGVWSEHQRIFLIMFVCMQNDRTSLLEDDRFQVCELLKRAIFLDGVSETNIIDFYQRIMATSIEHFRSILPLVNQNLPQLLKHKDAFDAFLTYAQDRTANGTALKAMLLRAFQYQEGQFITLLQGYVQQASALPIEKLKLLEGFFNSDADLVILSQSPAVFEKIMQYLNDLDYSVERATRLSQVLLKAAREEATVDWSQLFDGHSTQLKALTDEKFNGLMALVEDSMTSYAPFFETVIEYMSQEHLWVRQVEALSGVLTREQGLIPVFNTQLVALSSLPMEDYVSVLETINANRALLSAAPRVIEIMIQYYQDAAIPASNKPILSRLLISAVEYQSTYPEERDLLSSIDLLKFSNQATLERADGFLRASSIRSLKELAEQESSLQGIVNQFMDVDGRLSNDVQTVMGQPCLRTWFNFDDPTSRTARIQFMHILERKRLVSEQWGEDRNEAFLTAGLQCYTTKAETILQGPVLKKDVHRRHDLSTTQQSALLNLTDELAGLAALAAAPLVTGTLQQGLNELMTAYRKSGFNWSKLNSRKEQLRALETTVTESLTGYQTVWTAIRQARITAIENDITLDRNRRFFKVNRGGESRYLNTLNQMQELVLKHWSRDQTALRGEKLYSVCYKEEFYDLSSHLKTRMDEYMATTYPPGRKLGRFFKTPGELTTLKAQLDQFMAQYPTFDAIDIAALTGALSNALPKLPGHLKTLASEVSQRAEVLDAYLNRHT